MRRVVAMATTVAVLGLATPGQASADDTAAVSHLVSVTDVNQFPADRSFGLFYADCATPGATFDGDLGGPSISRGPVAPPLGTRSWGFAPPQAGGAVGLFQQVDDMSTLATARASFRAASAESGRVVAEVVDPGTGAVWFGLGTFGLTPGAWQTVSATGLALSWQAQVAPGQETPAPVSATVAGLLDLLTLPPAEGTPAEATPSDPMSPSVDPAPVDPAPATPSGYAGYIGLGAGCDGSGLVQLDDVEIGTATAVNTYNLDVPATSTTMTASTEQAVAGGSVTLSGLVTTVAGTPFVSAPLVLQQSDLGDSGWHDVGVALESYDGTQHPAQLTVRPVSPRTLYRWRYVESDSATGSYSPPVTVVTASRSR